MKLKVQALIFAVGTTCSILTYNTRSLHFANPQPGDGLRYLAFKTGQAVDDVLNTTGLCCAADYFIRQADIPYIITQPGAYYLAESITVVEGTAITIASDNVMLNLNNKMIEGIGGQSVHERAIEATGVNNLVIKNGLIKNCGSGIRLADSSNILDQIFIAQLPRKNITIDSINIWINKKNLCELPESATGIVLVNSLDAHVSNCNVYVDSDSFVCDDGPYSNSIHGIVLTGSQLMIDHCTVSGARNNFAFIGSQVICTDCISLTNPELMLTGTVTTGFTTAQMDSAYLYNCYAAGAVVNFNFFNTTNVCARNCVAFGGMTGYQANYNGMFFDCVATNNSSNGFHIGASCILRGCTALHNGYDGIYVDGNGTEIRDCSVAHNAMHGIDSNASGLAVFNNTVHDNTNGNLNNVADSDTSSKLDTIYSLLLSMNA